MSCELCDTDGGEILFTDERLRVVAVGSDEGARYRGFCRVVWHAHVCEMTDLAPHDRQHFMQAVYCVESALRLSLNPDKMNLASLGNMTPHLHWHVIPRFRDDETFPKPIWASTNRPVVATLMADDTAWKNAVRAAFS